MARPNRIRRTGAYYHITSRIVNKERWLSDPAFKDKIVDWIYDIADFSGVEPLAWAVMDNHFHIYLHVPAIPEKYLLASNGGQPPAGNHSGGQAPISNSCVGQTPAAENILQPAAENGDRPSAPAENGDRPSALAENGDRPSALEDEKGDRPTSERPAFMLSDDEMVRRLTFLRGEKQATVFRKNWEALRRQGKNHVVDAHKAAYCRRMYDVSEYVKTLKERISAHVNRAMKHVGSVFEGRFHSSLVEGGFRAGELVTLYIDYNPFKAGLAHNVADYRWSSLAMAFGGPRAERARRAYESIYGSSWAEVRAQILAAFADRLPAGVTGDRIPEGVRLRVSQIIRLKVDALSRGAFVAASMAFGVDALKALPTGFSRPSLNSLRRLLGIIDWGGRAA